MERRLRSQGKSILSMARNWRQRPQREIKIPWKRRQVWKFDQWSGDLGMNGRGSKFNSTCSFYIDENLIILHEDQRFFCFSSIQLCATLLTIAHQAPLSMGFSRQTYWSGLLCSPPRDVPNLGIGPRSPALQVDSLPSEPPGKPQRIERSQTIYVADFKHCLPWVLLLKIFAFPYVILVQYFAAILVHIRCDRLLGGHFIINRELRPPVLLPSIHPAVWWEDYMQIWNVEYCIPKLVEEEEIRDKELKRGLEMEKVFWKPLLCPP